MSEHPTSAELRDAISATGGVNPTRLAEQTVVALAALEVERDRLSGRLDEAHDAEMTLAVKCDRYRQALVEIRDLPIVGGHGAEIAREALRGDS